MLDKNDVALLKGMFGELLHHELKANNKVFGNDLKREIRDEVHTLITASESRLIKRMDRLRDEIVDDVGSLFDENVLPQITELQLKLA